MQTEPFVFPDEKPDTSVTSGEDKLEIHVEDDVPVEDRGKGVMPKNIVDTLENDDLEEYSEKVRNRMSQLKRVWHDERRAKESTVREKDEALRFAQAQLQENRQLKQRLGTGEKLFVQEITKAATNEAATAKEKLKLAHSSGDTDAIVEAQEGLTAAQLKLNDYYKIPATLQDYESSVQNQQQAQAPATFTPPPPDQKAVKWQNDNKWFGTDEEMTALALGLHEKLVRSGVDPSSDDYYDQVNRTIRRRFPENFEESDVQPRSGGSSPHTRKAAATVVAPATRSTAPRQVRLTPTQVSLAKRLGLTNEAYARELIKLENQNG